MSHSTTRRAFGVSSRAAALLLALCLLAASLAGCARTAQTETSTGTDYSQSDNWAYLPTEAEAATTEADVFFLCPTVYSSSEGIDNMPLDDEDARADFLGATNMEKGIYDTGTRFFAPYYRQIALHFYEEDAAAREPALAIAYEDVKAAFTYYMEHYNEGRPIILAGFSQGADLCLRLLKDCFADEATNQLLVACYAIGWSITEEEMAEYPHLKFATGESDTGVIIAFNSEAEGVENSFVVPNGTKTLGINPLNWRTDATPADRSLNLGACFTNYDGEITTEIPQLTGAYVDAERGTLKVTDVTPEEYPAYLSFCDEGVYHLYDYQFFYRNLQQNVQTRLAAYLAA